MCEKAFNLAWNILINKVLVITYNVDLSHCHWRAFCHRNALVLLLVEMDYPGIITIFLGNVSLSFSCLIMLKLTWICLNSAAMLLSNWLKLSTFVCHISSPRCCKRSPKRWKASSCPIQNTIQILSDLWRPPLMIPERNTDYECWWLHCVLFQSDTINISNTCSITRLIPMQSSSLVSKFQHT